MRETWKDVPGYEGIYQVSNEGKIRSCDRLDSNNHKLVGKNRSVSIARTGYMQLDLWKNSKSKQMLVHRIVAEAFLGECPKGYEVNHKDENKLNNNINNLEYVTRKENLNYGTRTTRNANNEKKKVKQISLNGDVVNIYDSATDAHKQTGICRQHISQCCCNSRKSAGGYLWEFAI